ncbi:A-kinase anchor protein 7-like [Narcine bancroftii]|uniref:A-kinase anchor protein 7-like n=1 Tax=Narcine bancroftii TaxID=1343680 RepID=UPI00383226D7
MDSGIISTSEEVCSRTLEDLTELPFYETDNKELFEVHNEECDQRSRKTRCRKHKRDRTQEVRGKSLPVGEGRRKPPNYFVSIPVTNPKILDRIEGVQELVVTKEPKLLPAIVPVGRMHLTIAVVHLNTPAEVEKAVTALHQCKSKVDAILKGKPLSLLFQGIGQFKDQILFAKLSEEMSNEVISRLRAVAESVEILFREFGVNIEDRKEFKPHATFLKLSKAPILRHKGLRKICPELYKEYQNSIFGTEVFTRIDLCSMHKKNQPSGYYHCESSISVGLNSTSCSSNFLLGNSEIASTLESLLISSEKSTKRIDLEMPHNLEDLKEESLAYNPHLTGLSAIESTNLDESSQNASRNLLTDDAFTQMDHPFTGILHVQREGFDKIHDDLVAIKATIQSSLDCTRVGIQNSLHHLESAIQSEPERCSAQSGLPAMHTGMEELKCIVHSRMECLERSIQCSFAVLNSNIAALNQNIVELAKVLTLIQACNPTDSLSQNT